MPTYPQPPHTEYPLHHHPHMTQVPNSVYYQDNVELSGAQNSVISNTPIPEDRHQQYPIHVGPPEQYSVLQDEVDDDEEFGGVPGLEIEEGYHPRSHPHPQGLHVAQQQQQQQQQHGGDDLMDTPVLQSSSYLQVDANALRNTDGDSQATGHRTRNDVHYSKYLFIIGMVISIVGMIPMAVFLLASIIGLVVLLTTFIAFRGSSSLQARQWAQRSIIAFAVFLMLRLLFFVFAAFIAVVFSARFLWLIFETLVKIISSG